VPHCSAGGVSSDILNTRTGASSLMVPTLDVRLLQDVGFSLRWLASLPSWTGSRTLGIGTSRALGNGDW
jgi:hypothetical protein